MSLTKIKVLEPNEKTMVARLGGPAGCPNSVAGNALEEEICEGLKEDPSEEADDFSLLGFSH